MNQEHHRPNKVAIVGAGKVGTTFAYTLLMSGLVSEIVLIDRDQARAEGEAMDLNHAAPLLHAARIWAGSYEDCGQAAVTVITAGSAQRPGETRLDLVQRNTQIFQQIVPNIVKHNPEGILLVATNPVDVLSYAAYKISGLPASSVVGSGTILDTARFRYLISQRFGVDPRSVHAYIIGEHGDSEVPVWSLANIAGMRIPDFCAMNGYQCDENVLSAIFASTRDAAYQIIERKGATYFAIAGGLLRIVEAILRDQATVMSVSSLIEDYYGIQDVYLSLPTVVDVGGIERVIRLQLSPQEIAGLQESASILTATIAQLDLE
jgi:L-lactate dehydrogenase